jgi:D-glycero-D-manno-heptose 1,7-bisphosphate phosphatase
VNHKFNRAIFLDRDGTINVDTHYPHDVQSLEFIPRALEGIRILSDLPANLIIVANQAGIALGYFKEDDMRSFDAGILNRVVASGGRIDGFYFCPHKEKKDLSPGEVGCECSKPEPGMLIEASKDFHIELSQSFMIGDKTSDVLAGKRAGCTTILVKTGKAGREEAASKVNPDYVVEDLYSAALLVREKFHPTQ